jgi:hypothetical protein
MPGTEKALSLMDVLVEAMECVVTDRRDVLSQVRFGRYTEGGAGWYWIAEFRSEVGSHPSTKGRNAQPLSARIKMTAAAWEDARTRYAEEVTDK